MHWLDSIRPRLVQETDSEKTCTLAVTLLPIGSSIYGCLFPFIIVQNDWFFALLIFQNTPNLEVQNILRTCEGTVLTTSGVRLNYTAHSEGGPRATACQDTPRCVDWDVRQL